MAIGKLVLISYAKFLLVNYLPICSEFLSVPFFNVFLMKYFYLSRYWCLYEAPKGTSKEKKQVKNNLKNISFPQNNISFHQNIISFPQNIISFPQNIIRSLEMILLPRNNLAGTEPLICHLIYWDMKTISEIAVKLRAP